MTLIKSNHVRHCVLLEVGGIVEVGGRVGAIFYPQREVLLFFWPSLLTTLRAALFDMLLQVVCGQLQ